MLVIEDLKGRSRGGSLDKVYRRTLFGCQSEQPSKVRDR